MSAQPPAKASQLRRAQPPCWLHRWRARFHLAWRSSRHLLVAVVVTPPDALFIASLRGAVEPLVRAPEPVQSAGIGRIGMIDDAVFEDESAEARPLAHIGDRLGAGPGRILDHDRRKRRLGHRVAAASITSWLVRCTAMPLKPSAIEEQEMQPAL